MTLLQIIDQLVISNDLLTAQSENFEQALRDERASGVEEGVRSRDQEVADMIASNESAMAEVVAQHAAAMAEAEAAKIAFGESEYTRGFTAGVDSDGEKIYTQADMDAAKAESDAKLEELRVAVEAERVSFQEQINALSQQLSDLDASIPGKIADAVAEFKAVLKAEYANQQVAESEGETGFGSLLD